MTPRIYRYKCDRVGCNEQYIEEYSRTFRERLKEHLKVPFPMHDHHNIRGPTTTIQNINIVGRDDQNLITTIKEALYIRVNNTSPNKNIGRYHLPRLRDDVLFNPSELIFK